MDVELQGAAVMTIPAQALGLRHPEKMEPGELFKFRGHWALRVSYGLNNEIPGFLLLEGERAGELHLVRSGMAPCLTIFDPFTWFPVVSEGEAPRSDLLKPTTLGICASGVVIVGIDVGDDNEIHAFLISGHESQDYDGGAASFQFDQWRAVLAHNAEPFKSLGTLVHIDRRTKEE